MLCALLAVLRSHGVVLCGTVDSGYKEAKHTINNFSFEIYIWVSLQRCQASIISSCGRGLTFSAGSPGFNLWPVYQNSFKNCKFLVDASVVYWLERANSEPKGVS